MPKQPAWAPAPAPGSELVYLGQCAHALSNIAYGGCRGCQRRLSSKGVSSCWFSHAERCRPTAEGVGEEGVNAALTAKETISLADPANHRPRKPTIRYIKKNKMF